MLFPGRKQDDIPGKYGHLFFFRRTDTFPGSNDQHLITGMDMKLVFYTLGKIYLASDELFALFAHQYGLKRYRSGK